MLSAVFVYIHLANLQKQFQFFSKNDLLFHFFILQNLALRSNKSDERKISLSKMFVLSHRRKIQSLTLSFFFGNLAKLYASICIESKTFYKVLFESLTAKLVSSFRLISNIFSALIKPIFSVKIKTHFW